MIKQNNEKLNLFILYKTCVNLGLHQSDTSQLKRYRDELIKLLKKSKFDIPDITDDIKSIVPQKYSELWTYPPNVFEMAKFIANDASNKNNTMVKGFKSFQEPNINYILNYMGAFKDFTGPDKDRTPVYMLKFCAFLSVWFEMLNQIDIATQIDKKVQYLDKGTVIRYNLIKGVIKHFVKALKALY